MRYTKPECSPWPPDMERGRVDKREKLNPQITLDEDPMHDPRSPDFPKPEGWTAEEISFYFERALKVLNHDNFTTAKEYIDLLVNQCLAEKHWSDAFTYFLTKVREMGLEIETDQDKYNTIQERLFYWRTIRMQIHAAGLVRYEDEIMKYEIAKYYQPINPLPVMPQPRVREVPVARPQRRTSNPKQQQPIANPVNYAGIRTPRPVKPAAKPKASPRINKPRK